MMSRTKRMGRGRGARALALAGMAGLAPLALADDAAGLETQRAASSRPALLAEAAEAASVAWAQEDPADSLYRAAREALNRGRYGEAVNLFREIRNGYPESAYVP
jgi:TolA-binding protein